jgi:hypothetical protein
LDFKNDCALGDQTGMPARDRHAAVREGDEMLKRVRENAGWAQIVVAWLAAVAIGIVIYFFPIARLLASLGQ